MRGCPFLVRLALLPLPPLSSLLSLSLSLSLYLLFSGRATLALYFLYLGLCVRACKAMNCGPLSLSPSLPPSLYSPLTLTTILKNRILPSFSLPADITQSQWGGRPQPLYGITLSSL